MRHLIRTQAGVALFATALLFSFVTEAQAEIVTCKRAIAKASAKYVQARHKALQKCVATRRKEGAPPAGALATCTSDETTATKLNKAVGKLEGAIDKACGGADGMCGGDMSGEDLPPSIDWPASCPNFENGPCTTPILDCNDITGCIQCVGTRAVDQVVTVDYEPFVDQAVETDENDCQVGITSSVVKFFNTKSKTLAKCWDAALKGKDGYSVPCPAGDASGGTALKIGSAEAKNFASICKACNGGGDADEDGLCDSAGFDPQTVIGFGLTCPLLAVPGGQDCGAIGAVDTLSKYADCVTCVAAFKVECLDHLATVGDVEYPAECNPLSRLELPTTIAVGKNLQMPSSITLTIPAPPGNLPVTVTSADPTRVLLSTSSTTAGSASITLSAPDGTYGTQAYYVQALESSGSVVITATAPGYASDTSSITLEPSGFVTLTSDFATTTVSANHILGLGAARLSAGTLAFAEYQTLRGGLTVHVPVSSGTPAVGSIVGSPSPIVGGDVFNYGTAFHAISAGSSVVTVDAPAGFDTPSSGADVTATVTVPRAYFSYASCSDGYYYATTIRDVGRDLQNAVTVCLEAPPSSAVDVTITSDDGAVVTVSTVAELAGSASVVRAGIGTINVGTAYVQGRSLAATTLTVSAPGYSNGSMTVNVRPSGFVLLSPGGDFSTTSLSPDTALGVYSVRLDPATLNYAAAEMVRGGLSVNVPLTSDTPAVGDIVGSPVTFDGPESNNSDAAFHPISTGTTTIAVGVPAGFDTPSNYRQELVTVTVPRAFLSYYGCYYGYSYPLTSVEVGRDLQVLAYVCLETTPPGSVDVTVTSSDAAVVTVDSDATVEGGVSETFVGVTSTHVGYVYVQGRSLSSTTLTVAAAGFSDVGTTATVRPSGFILANPGSTLTTTTFSANTAVTLYSARLNPSTLAYVSAEPVRGGLSVDVPVSSDTPSVGTIVGSPVAMSGGTLFYSSAAEFDPVSSGTTLLAVGVPAGFDTPSSLTQSTVTVTAPHAFLSYYPCDYGYNYLLTTQDVGRDLQAQTYVCLESAPPTPVDVTVTSDDGGVVTLSTNPALAGSASATFTGVTTTLAGTIFMQGRSLAGTTLTVEAAAYTDGTTTVNVRPSGFVILSSNFSTTAYSAGTNLSLYSAILNPGTLAYSTTQPLRGGLTVDVPVSSDSPGVGDIIGSPDEFAANEGSSDDAVFDPASAGTAVVSVGVPAGFSSPSNYRQITVTVTPPHAFLTAYPCYYGYLYYTPSSWRVGRDLQVSAYVCLEAPPPGPVDVSVTSSDGGIVTLTTDPTLAGGSSATYLGVSTISAGSVSIQGRSSGSPTLTVHAAGYEDGTPTATVDPSGFITFQSNFSTTTTSANTAIYLYAARLDQATLNFAETGMVRGGLSVDVPMVSATPSVGDMLGSPATFVGPQSYSYDVQFDPVSAGTSVLSLGVPAGFNPPSNYWQLTATVNP